MSRTRGCSRGSPAKTDRALVSTCRSRTPSGWRLARKHTIHTNTGMITKRSARRGPRAEWVQQQNVCGPTSKDSWDSSKLKCSSKCWGARGEGGGEQVLGSAKRGRRRGLAGRQPRDSPRRLAAAPASAAHSGTCAGHIPWECATLAMSSTIWQYTRPVCPAVVPHTRLPGPNPMPGGVAPRG